MERETLVKTLRLMRPRKVHRLRLRKKPVTIGRRTFGVRMKGGPLSFANLHSSGTLPFRIGEWHGYYDRENRWVEL